MVTFGGAYAVLPYVAQKAVEEYHWLNAGQMLDGLGLAETTPGPLIMVLQFVGFLGAWNHPGNLAPTVAATLGALITTWTTFVPCFLWIFLGAPHIEALRGIKTLSAALSAITSAVVGVVGRSTVDAFIAQRRAQSGDLVWISCFVLQRWRCGLACGPDRRHRIYRHDEVELEHDRGGCGRGIAGTSLLTNLNDTG